MATQPLFNQVTNLVDLECYKKRLQESTDIYEYRTAISPTPPCYMQNMAVQGDSPPSGKLIDVETYLRTQPLREEIQQYVTGRADLDKAPVLPDILQNRVLLPDCQDVIQTSYDEHKIDGVWNREYNYGPQQFSLVTEPAKQQFVASVGIDTRMVMRDEFKKRRQATELGDTAAVPAEGSPEAMTDDPDLLIASVPETQNDAGPSVGAPVYVIDPTKTLAQLVEELP